MDTSCILKCYAGRWAGPARDRARVSVLPGALSHTVGLALVVNRWPAVLSLQFVLPGSPALLISATHQLQAFPNELRRGTVYDLYRVGLNTRMDDGNSNTGRTLLLANDERALSLLYLDVQRRLFVSEESTFHTKSSEFFHNFSFRGLEIVFVSELQDPDKVSKNRFRLIIRTHTC